MKELRSNQRSFWRFLFLGALVWITTCAASPKNQPACQGDGSPIPTLGPLNRAGDFGPPILAYLNALGSANGLQEAFSRLHNPSNPGVIYQARVVSRDVTGNGTVDVIVNISLPTLESRALFVFSCSSGKFISLYQNKNDPTLIAVKDMDLDGKAEIIFSSPDCTVGCMVYYDILEWNGQEFTSLVRNNDPPCYGPCLARGHVEFADLAHNGTLAFVLVQGWDIQYGPGCNRRVDWEWNGKAFVPSSQPICLPQYRLHAVYAGDDAARAGNFVQALHYYQQVIFEAGLLPGRNWQQPLISTSKSTPAPDPQEWDILSAYARYRIMLLQILWKDEPSALLVYHTLAAFFPAGASGHAYAELASAFWEAYQQTHLVNSSCGQAIQYASSHAKDVLTPLGQAVYGKNNRDYMPYDICPFQ